MKKTSRQSFRRLLICFLALYLLITLAPPLLYHAVPGPGETLPEGGAPSPSPEPAATPSPAPLPGPLEESAPGEDPGFTLRDAATGETLHVGARDFLMADLACEMDLHAPQEALKAQAVASFTYYSRMRQAGQEIPCDSGSWLVYVPEEAMRQRWGEDYEEYRAILEGAVDAVLGQTLTYGGEPALACYFAISPGSTENAWDVWSGDAGAEHPYLQAVASPGDLFSDGYLSRAQFTAAELEAAFPGADLSGDPEGWLTDAERTPSGMVKSVKVGGVEAGGTEIRSALGLRSACFEWTAADGALSFTVRGWGHGVGMSQAGAVFLAKRGAGYKEILAHYYPGTVLEGA